jgi:hypothetical protein
MILLQKKSESDPNGLKYASREIYGQIMRGHQECDDIMLSVRR